MYIRCGCHGAMGVPSRYVDVRRSLRTDAIYRSLAEDANEVHERVTGPFRTENPPPRPEAGTSIF